MQNRIAHESFSDRGAPRPETGVEFRRAANVPQKNSYRLGWEQFLRHVAEGDALRSPMLEGAKELQLTELCSQSGRERRWIDVPTLEQSL